MPSRNSIQFPPLSRADSSGLLMLGGELTPDWLIAAYEQAIFPWPIVHYGCEILAWFSPDPRAILELDEFHASRRLRRRLRRGEFEVTGDEAFVRVMHACAEPRLEQPESETWITPAMIDAYARLHQLGHAHSVEVWREGELVGGVYGVSLGGFFAGESMFYRCRDASKVALFHLVHHLSARGYSLLDIQQATQHTRSLGAREISRRRYCRRLRAALRSPVTFGRDLTPLGNGSLSTADPASIEP